MASESQITIGYGPENFEMLMMKLEKNCYCKSLFDDLEKQIQSLRKLKNLSVFQPPQDRS